MNFVGLAGLVASFFRLFMLIRVKCFALSVRGYLHENIVVTNNKHAPKWAIVIPGVIGFVLSLPGKEIC